MGSHTKHSTFIDFTLYSSVCVPEVCSRSPEAAPPLRARLRLCLVGVQRALRPFTLRLAIVQLMLTLRQLYIPTQLLRATSNSSRVTLRQSRVPEEPSTTNTPSFTLGCGGWALLCHGSLPWPSPAVWGSSLSFLSPFFSLSLFSLFSFFFSHSLIDALSARPLPRSRMRSPGLLWPGLLQSLPHPFNRR